MKDKSQFDALCWEVSKQYWRALGKPEMIKFIQSVAEKRQNKADEKLDSEEP